MSAKRDAAGAAVTETVNEVGAGYFDVSENIGRIYRLLQNPMYLNCLRNRLAGMTEYVRCKARRIDFREGTLSESRETISRANEIKLGSAEALLTRAESSDYATEGSADGRAPIKGEQAEQRAKQSVEE